MPPISLPVVIIFHHKKSHALLPLDICYGHARNENIACRCCPVGMTNIIDISWFRNVSPSKESMKGVLKESILCNRVTLLFAEVCLFKRHFQRFVWYKCVSLGQFQSKIKLWINKIWLLKWSALTLIGTDQKTRTKAFLGSFRTPEYCLLSH